MLSQHLAALAAQIRRFKSTGVQINANQLEMMPSEEEEQQENVLR